MQDNYRSHLSKLLEELSELLTSKEEIERTSINVLENRTTNGVTPFSGVGYRLGSANEEN